jgi:hypothetical protein
LPETTIVEIDVDEYYCGDGVHDPTETIYNCCIDVGCPAHQYCSESLMKCVRRAEDVDSGTVLTLVLNVETLYIKMDNLKASVVAIRDYYNTKGDTDKYNNWSLVADEFDLIISELDELKAYLRNNKDNLTESVLENAREAIVEIRQSLHNVVDMILGAL